MESFKNLYKRLWQSLIKPRRIPYNEEDLGGTLVIFESYFAVRLDFQLYNALGEAFYTSIYFPCDKDENVPNSLDFVVYCHTHNGSRVEGLGLLERLLSRDMGLVVFDFRANGFSTGEYVTLGWLEALDINEVCCFLKKEVRANSITLWGRSMGACAAMFFLSPYYRQHINTVLHHDGKFVEWLNPKFVDCLILDSPFPTLTSCIHNLVKTKASKVPKWVVNLSIKLINREIKNKAGISIYKVNPAAHVKHINTPVHLILGNDDEIIDTELFYPMYKAFSSKIKKVTMFQGTHAEERPEDLQIDLISYIKHVLALRKSYLLNREISMSNIFTNNMNITHNYLDYTKSRLHENFDKKVQKTKLTTQHRSYMPMKPTISVIPSKPTQEIEELKHHLQKDYERNILKSFKFSLHPLNDNKETNQFDVKQMPSENNIPPIIDKNTLKNFIIEHEPANQQFNIFNDETDNNATAFNGLSIRYIPKHNLNNRLTFIRPVEPIIEQVQFQTHNADPYNNSPQKDIKHPLLFNYNTTSYENARVNTIENVYVPQYKYDHNTDRPKIDHQYIRTEHGRSNSMTIRPVHHMYIPRKHQHRVSHIHKHDHNHHNHNTHSDRKYYRTKTDKVAETLDNFLTRRSITEPDTPVIHSLSELKESDIIEGITVYIGKNGKTIDLDK